MRMEGGMTHTSDRPSLREDQRGAVMLTGVFMAFVLVGALWYVMGIGEVLVFRDRMQEAADSAAFTSAIYNAKGMNFISVCNLIMFVLVVVYLIVAIIQDATILTCLACAFLCVTCCLACPFVPDVIEANQSTARVVKTGLNIMTALEAGAAIGYPWMGTARSHEVGAKYKVRENQYSTHEDKNKEASVYAFGMSNIPAVGGGWAGPVPLGLPVQGEKYSNLCEIVGKDAVGAILGFALGANSHALGKFINKVVDGIKDIAGAALKLRYCNDLTFAGGDDTTFAGATADPNVKGVRDRLGQVQDKLRNGQDVTDEKGNRVGGVTQNQDNTVKADGIKDGLNADFDVPKKEGSEWRGWSPWFDPGFDKGWGDKGFLVVQDSAGNGTQQMQVWSINKNPRYFDDHEKKVSYGAKTRSRDFAENDWQGPQSWGYYAQAEFYYDCDKAWAKEECNGDDHNASFGIRWRARLRHVQGLSITQILKRFLQNKATEKIKEATGKLIDKMVERFIPGGEIFGQTKFGADAIDGITTLINDSIVSPLLDKLNGQLDKLSEFIEPTKIKASYH